MSGAAILNPLVSAEKIYLLTFWPPGPDDRENVVLATDAGIEFLLNFENHWRAASSSSSSSTTARDEYTLEPRKKGSWVESCREYRDLRTWLDNIVGHEMPTGDIASHES